MPFSAGGPEGPFSFPGSPGFFRANDDRCSDGEGVCLTGGDFVPFVFNESSADCLTVAVDGAKQTVPLLSSLPDVHTAAAVLRKGLTGVRVDIIRGNNSARNATSPVESLQLTCTSKGSSTFVQINPACENCSRGALLFGVGGAGGGAANGFVGTDPTPNITMISTIPCSGS